MGCSADRLDALVWVLLELSEDAEARQSTFMTLDLGYAGRPFSSWEVQVRHSRRAPNVAGKAAYYQRRVAALPVRDTPKERLGDTGPVTSST